jgi:uncharacterized membrane protein YczE
MAGRVALFLGGTTVSTLCYALTIRAGLGLGPLFVLQDGFARTTGISIGAAVTATGFMCVAVAMCLRFWPGPGTLAQPVLGGVTLNAVLPHVPTLHGWPLRIAVVFVATWVMALGGVMMIRARVGVAAYDSVMLGLHRVLRRRRLALIRLGMEATVLVVGFVLGGAVGVGTLITGGLIGPGIHFWLRLTGGPLPVPAPPAVAVAVADWEPSPTGATG